MKIKLGSIEKNGIYYQNQVLNVCIIFLSRSWQDNIICFLYDNHPLPYRSSESLPLPDTIKTLFSAGSKREDNPEIHDGRIRTFEHLEGNWATHISLSCMGSFLNNRVCLNACRIMAPFLNKFSGCRSHPPPFRNFFFLFYPTKQVFVTN